MQIGHCNIENYQKLNPKRNIQEVKFKDTCRPDYNGNNSVPKTMQLLKTQISPVLNFNITKLSAGVIGNSQWKGGRARQRMR